MNPVHTPVMPGEVLEYLIRSPDDQLLIVDGTLGEGGHSLRFLETCPNSRVIGIDADPVMAGRAAGRLEPWNTRFELRRGWTDEILISWAGRSPDVILMDLGISSYHYELGGRGFSFRSDERLDMRINPDGGQDAADLVNNLGEEALADIIFRYGEERFSRRIARLIVQERKNTPIVSAGSLASIVVRAVPPSAKHGRIHAATRTFQALRIAVNGELDRLSRILDTAPGLLAPGGRLGIISFHSLEDRLVKNAFRLRDMRYGGDCRVVTRKPLVPTDEECRVNPPSRSAKFRVLERPAEGDSR